MESQYIKKVNEADFEYEVIAFSSQIPVVVDFWAEWCRPCKSLTPILEKITQESNGSFRLAEINVDDNPNITLRYSVRSIPNVKAFRDGQVVSEFLGLQPEARVREFIRNLAPSQVDLVLEKGLSQIDALNWSDALKSFTAFLEKSPNHPAGMLGLLKSYIMLGDFTAAKKIMEKFPPSPEFARMQTLQPLYDVLSRQHQNQDVDDTLEAAYQNAINLIHRRNLPAAMDGLIDILRQDKHYHNDEVRKVMLGIFEILGDNHPLTVQYRKELSMVLF